MFTKKLYQLFGLIAALTLLSGCYGWECPFGQGCFDQPPTPKPQGTPDAAMIKTMTDDCTTIVRVNEHVIRPLSFAQSGTEVFTCDQKNDPRHTAATDMSALMAGVSGSCSTTVSTTDWSYNWNAVQVDGVTVTCANPPTDARISASGFDLNGTLPMEQFPQPGKTYVWASVTYWGFFMLNENYNLVVWIPNGTEGSMQNNGVYNFDVPFTGYVLDRIVAFVR